MEYKDYYKIMGVDKKASQEEIKKAYRKLAVKFHPDKNPGNKAAESSFKTMNEANGVLSDPAKRKKYDELGENWQQYENRPAANNNGRTQGGQPFGGQSNANPSDFSDFFEQFFGGSNENGPRGQRNFRGSDYETEIQITLEEAFAGTSRIIQLENEKIRVAPNAGTYDGQQLRIKGKGGTGSSTNLNGDLIVKIKITPNPNFTRKGDDLYVTGTVDLYTAILGGDIIVHTLNGKVKVKIEAGSQNGKNIRLKGKGMPVYGKSDLFGNLYVSLFISIPENLTPKQKELFEELRSLAN